MRTNADFRFGSFSTDPTILACRFMSVPPRKRKPNHQVELAAMWQKWTSSYDRSGRYAGG
jgi:hypothetical protein